MTERSPVHLKATVYKKILGENNTKSSVTLNVSAGLSQLVGDHHIGVGDNNGKTSIALQTEPPCVVLNNSVLGKLEMPIYNSTGETVTVSHSSQDIKLTVVFPASELK